MRKGVFEKFFGRLCSLMFVHNFWDFLSSHFLMASLAVGFATLQNGSGFIICLHGLLQFTTLIAFMSRYPPLYIDSLARSVLFSSPALTLSYFAGIYSFDGHLAVGVYRKCLCSLFCAVFYCSYFRLEHCHQLAHRNQDFCSCSGFVDSGSYSFLNQDSPLLEDLSSNHLL